jgi:diguanylate cyclase (GGDEF)-like protein
MEAAVDRIREEVANVVPFHWFQFELLASDRGGARSWWSAGFGHPGGGELHDGEPRPDPHPPPLPGIHRRPEWRLLERNLAWGERAGARLRLWCDPRQLDGEDLELLDALLPQMSASVRQSLLDREAREDRLTGTAVRRVLETRLLGAYRAATESGSPLAVIMCDLDHFKAINDSHGHLTGDRALAACAAALAQHKRSGDLLARYGGEEFTLLLEATDGDTALAVAERLRRAVEALRLEVDGTPVPLRISAGVAAYPELHVKTAAELLLLADAALYEAKRRGRNRCLLDLGAGRHRTPDGEVVETENRRPEPEAPRIFA